MYFGLPDDAAALKEGLREVLETACTPATIRSAWDGDANEALWKTLGEFGVIGLLVPEERGGLGLDALAFVAAMEECGYAGVPGPLVETVAFLPALDLPSDGSARVAVKDSGPVAHAGWATVVVAPRTGSVIEPAQVDAVETVDASRRAGFVSGPSSELPVTTFYDAVELGKLGTAAFLVGLARRQVAITVEYAKTRQQFGVAIGSYQAIKHPVADAVVAYEFAWPAVLAAAQALVEGAPDASRRVSMAKALASDAGYQVSRVCLQAHGAMGYTVEYDLHLFMKRTWALAADWGSASDHRKKIAKELLG